MPIELERSLQGDFHTGARVLHNLTVAEREALTKFYTMQLTIPSMSVRALAEDWFGRVGLRFRMKPRLWVRLMRAQASRPVFY